MDIDLSNSLDMILFTAIFMAGVTRIINHESYG